MEGQVLRQVRAWLPLVCSQPAGVLLIHVSPTAKLQAGGNVLCSRYKGLLYNYRETEKSGSGYTMKKIEDHILQR